MQAKKVAGRQGPGGGWSGEMDPNTRAAAAAPANALFIFSTFKTRRQKIAATQVKPYAHSQLAIRPGLRFLNARTALLILPAHRL
jgi:hypothetical protein